MGAAVLLLVAVVLTVRPLLRRLTATDPVDAQPRASLEVLRAQLAELEQDHASGKIEPDQYRQTLAELERRALKEGRADDEATPLDVRPAPVWAMATVLFVPTAALAVWFVIGSPAALDPAATVRPDEITEADIQNMVGALQSRLTDEPDNVDGWRMLGRSMTVLGRFAEAYSAFERAVSLAPERPDLYLDWADAVAAEQSGALSGKPVTLAERALELDPAQPRALAILGTAAFQQADYEGAIRYWQQLRMRIGDDVPQLATSLDEGIAAARARLDAATPGATVPEQVSTKGAELTIQGRVTLPDATDGYPDSAVVFVFVRSPSGGPPFAALRQPASALPFAFDFSDVAPMMPGRPLPDALEIVARLSHSGQPMPSSGDLESLPRSVAADSRNIELVLSELRP